jgi:hypothetical protein
MRRVIEKFALAMIAIGGVNFLAFCAIGIAVGGDAYGGKVEGGRYYLNMNGRFTECSRAAWNCRRAHLRSLFVTVPMFAAGAIVMGRLGRQTRAGGPGATG